MAAKSNKSSTAEAVPTVRVHIWLETGRGISFGMGRLLLLEAIEELGSLRAAAEHLGMSYRAAWGKVKGSEKLLGRPLIEKLGGNRAGFTLTDFGRSIMESYRDWFDRVECTAIEEAARVFNFPTRGFEERE